MEGPAGGAVSTPHQDTGGLEEPSQPLPPQLKNALLTVLFTGMIFAALLLMLDAVIPQGEWRLLVAGILTGVLGLVLALSASFWTREPMVWRHRFLPQTHADLALPRTASFLGAEIPPGSPYVSQERLVAAAWVREVLTERLMLARGLTPSQLGAIMDRPNEAELLDDVPNLRRVLADTKDLAVAPKGSVLMMSRKEFLKIVDKALEEAKSL